MSHKSVAKREGKKSMKIGYARVSTDEQNLDLQLDALQEAGCESIYKDEGISGASPNRKGLDEALNTLNPGDVLVVWKLDRLGRSLQHLIHIIEKLGACGIGFRSLSESIDTTTAGGKLIFHIFGALAEFERGLIAERTKAGLQAVMKRGKRLGRPSSLTQEQLNHAAKIIDSGEETVSGMAQILGVNRATLYRGFKDKY
jgi:DNA invertase Pin-like site-specific DNA recombinase